MEYLARQVRELVVASDHYRQWVGAGWRLSPIESAVVGHLFHNPAQTPSMIARRLGLTSATTAGLVHRLSLTRLVTRKRNPADRRSAFVELTELGRATVSEMYTIFVFDIDMALQQSDPRLRKDPAYRETVVDLLGHIAVALRERCGDQRGVEEAISPFTPQQVSRADSQGAGVSCNGLEGHQTEPTAKR